MFEKLRKSGGKKIYKAAASFLLLLTIFITSLPVSASAGDLVQYIITYDLDGGSISGERTTYTEEDSFTLPTPTKTGYTFEGWTGSCGSSPQPTVTISKGTQGNKTYAANWSLNTYTISYALNGGYIEGRKTTYTVNTGDYTLPTPTKEGYTFLGWTGSNGSTPQASVTIPKGSTGDRSYTANWKANTYTATLHPAGGTLTTTDSNIRKNADGTMKLTMTYGKNDFYKLAVNATKPGYTFYGFFDATSGGSRIWDATSGECSYDGKYYDINGLWVYPGNVDFYAQWKANTYKVAYYENGTNVLGVTFDSTHTYDVESPLSTNSFMRKGYTFTGWNTKEDGSGDAYEEGQNVKNLTTEKGVRFPMYAQWSPNPYTMTFHYGKTSGLTGADDQTKTVYYEQPYGILPSPKCDGWTFNGWNTKEDGSGNMVTKDDICTGDIDVYAQWTYDPVAVSVPQTLIGDQNGNLRFMVKTAIKSGRITVDMPDGFYYSQDGREDVYAAITPVDGNIITKDHKTAEYTVTTGGLTAGMWSGSFTIGLTLEKF